MKFEALLLFVTIATTLAGTNVNISFTQHHSRNGSNISEKQNDKIQLKSTDSSELYNDEKNSKFARIQVDENKFEAVVDNSSRVTANVRPIHDATADYRSERVQSEEREGFFGSHAQNQQRSFYNHNREAHKMQSQFRSLSPQDMENMEFERYIQNYHSGPTVETVYESAKPEMQISSPASSIQERSQRVMKFERQVALPSKTVSVQPSSDPTKAISSHQSGSPSSVTSSPPLLPVIPGVNTGSAGGNGFKVNLNQNPPSGGKNDLHYNKPIYNDPTSKYNNEHSDVHFHNQFPPSFEESHNGYGDYYSNIYNRQQIMEGYHPNEQRPVITKTIQIAQPAIKAKKYEVRHPAIQKEFYDIEERVVIKPAGTVVVELERPSAKILKEETTLPLGHPHPAVAAAYMQNRNTQAYTNTIYRNEASSFPSHQSNEYIPQQAYSGPASPSYDQSTKEISAETNQNKQFTAQGHYSASTAESPKQQSRDIIVLTDSHGNQRQVSADQFTYSHDESSKTPSRAVLNNRNSFVYKNNDRSNEQESIASQHTGLQSTHDNREDFSFDVGYISSSDNPNLRKENKPARLQDIRSERVVEHKQPPQPIIKHEHKIVLSPSQHNIYLSQNQEVPKTKFIEESTEAHLQNHREPIIYEPANQVSDLEYLQRSHFHTPSRALSHGRQLQSAQQRSKVAGSESRVIYSQPYAQMRLYSEQDQRHSEQQYQKQIVGQQKSEKLISEDKQVEKLPKEKLSENDLPHAHIEIKIPNSSSDKGNEPIFVSSTIRPVMMTDGHDESHNSKLEISVRNNGEPEKERNFDNEFNTNDKKYGENESKNLREKDTEKHSNTDTETESFSEQVTKSENYEVSPKHQQKFLRIVESSSAAPLANDAASSAQANAVQSNIQPNNVDVNVKSSTGQVSPAGSRVIASTAAPKESNPSESFHKRRIVVNHPFQTVREIVEHEPYTKYHEVQVHEPATPALYHSANYYKPNGALHQSNTLNSQAYYS